MTLEFIVSCEIEPWKKTRIKIPEGATHYKCRSGKIKFFRVNPEPKKGMKYIFDNAFEIEFYMQRHVFNIEYGDPKFYDSNNNILKLGCNS